ncbi:MAG TPA: TRAP transporter substrate-binding protein DctP [Azospirillum sp.]|nr:TRAP transporter substrate-binding protein DctP [Azospirillum sp.]
MSLHRIALLGIVMQMAFHGTANAADQFNWRYYAVIPSTHDFAKNVIASFARIGERSDGRLKIRYVYYGETPYKATDALTVLKNRQVEMTEWLPSYSAGTYPILAGPELPFLLPEKSDAKTGQASIDRAWATPTMESELQRIVGDNGGQILSRYYFEPMNFWLSTPASTLAELKDKRIRVFSPELSELVTAIGASPVSLAQPEVYTALQRNTLSGVITGVGNIRGAKWNEVLRSGYIANLMFTSTSILAGNDAVAKLPADLKTILVEEMKALSEKQRALMPESDQAKKSELRTASGFSVAEASPEDYAALREIASARVWPGWKSRAGERAGPVLDEIAKALKAN